MQSRLGFLSVGAAIALSWAGCDSDDGDGSTADTGAQLDEDAILTAAAAYATDLVRVNAEPSASQHAVADAVNFFVAPQDLDLYTSIDPSNPTEVTFPEGALVVKESLVGSGDPDGFFAIFKAFEGYDPEGNDWYWLKVDGAGETTDAGTVGFCKDCHSGTPLTDFVFGVPTDNRIE